MNMYEQAKTVRQADVYEGIVARQAPDHSGSLLEQLHKDLEGLAQSADVAASRLEQVADRVLGIEPKDVASRPGNENRPSLPRLAEIEHAVREIRSRISYLHDQVSRLERL